MAEFVESQLKGLKQIDDALSEMKVRRKESFAFWSIWKYYAQNQEWFNDFIKENDIPYDELKYPQKNDLSTIEASREYGQKLWDQRKEILDNIEDLKSQKNYRLVRLRESEVTFDVIGEALGVTPGAVHKYMVSQGLIANV